jgi:hypothetical protein
VAIIASVGQLPIMQDTHIPLKHRIFPAVLANWPQWGSRHPILKHVWFPVMLNIHILHYPFLVLR